MVIQHRLTLLVQVHFQHWFLRHRNQTIDLQRRKSGNEDIHHIHFAPLDEPNQSEHATRVGRFDGIDLVGFRELAQKRE